MNVNFFMKQYGGDYEDCFLVGWDTVVFWVGTNILQAVLPSFSCYNKEERNLQKVYV